MNRYSRVQPSQFDPLSLQEIMAVPLARQKNHDNTLASIDELGLFDLNRLQQDEEQATGFISDYTKKLQSKADEILERGVNQSSMREMMKLKNERDNFLQGDGKKMQDAYTAYKENEEAVQKMIAQGMSGTRAQEILDQAKAGYKGVAEGPYKAYYGAREADAGKYMQDAVEKLDKSKFVRESGLQDVGNGYLRVTKESMESINPVYVKNGVIHQDDLVKNYAYNRAMQSPEIQADLAHRQRVDPNNPDYQPDANGSIPYLETLAESTNYAYNAIDRDIQSQYLRKPEEDTGSSKSGEKEKAFEGYGTYSFNESTRPIFSGMTSPKDIQKTYNNLLAEGKANNDSKKTIEGRRLKNYYETAVDQFKSARPELVKKYNDIQYTEAFRKLKNLGFDTSDESLEALANIGLNQAVGITGTSITLHQNGENSYKIVSGLNLDEDLPYEGRSITKNDLKIIKEGIANNKNVIQEYNKELDNHLDIFSDNTQTFVMTGLTSGTRNTINEDLKSTIFSPSVGNINTTSIINEDGKPVEDQEDKDELIEKIKLGDYDIKFMSLTTQDENGLPNVEIKYTNNNDKEEFGVMNVQLDKTFTEGTGSRNVQGYIIDAFSQHGGQEGKIIAERARDIVEYKNIIPNTKVDYSQNNEIKNVISNSTKQKLNEKMGDDYKLDLQKTGDYYTVMAQFKTADGGTSAKSLTWKDLFSNNNELAELGTSSMAQYVLDQIASATNKRIDDITLEEYNQYTNALLENNDAIKMTQYRDLLNLLGK